MKKNSRKMLCMLALGLCMGLSGCSSKVPEEPLDVETSKGSDGIEHLSVEDFSAKVEHGDEFVVMITTSTCSYCKEFKRSLLPYLRDHEELPFYEIEVDTLGEKKSDTSINMQKLQALSDEITGATPQMLFFSGGKVKDSAEGAISEIAMENFFIDAGLIEGEKREETITTYSLTTDDMETGNYVSVAKKITDKETFYLYIGEEDRFNEAFSKKLNTYVKENDVNLYVMNLTKLNANTSQSEELTSAINTISSTFANLQLTPTVFKIVDGAVSDGLMDNVSEDEIAAFFTSQK